MSLHAQLSPEALQRLHAQRRNSTISSVVIAVLVIVLVGLVLGLFLLPHINKDPEVIVSYNFEESDDPPDDRVPKETIQKKPSSPSSSAAKIITAVAISDVAVPVPDISFDPPSADFGEGDNFGSGFGGQGSGSGFDRIPATMRKRCNPQDRLKRLKEAGGSVKCEKAVMSALRWIKQTQNPDGSWGDKYQVAMTGFSILAYLGHCETPKSPEFGDSVTKGLTYLIDHGMKNDGKLQTENSISAVYEHGIATYALAEAYTFCKDMDVNIPNLKKITKMAGDRIMDGQSPVGGFNYGYGQQPTGDNSVGYWQIQALKACKHTGIWTESKFKRVSRKAMDFLEKVQGANGAIGYREDSKRSPGLTGGGVLCFQMWGEGESKAAKKGVEYVRENTKFEWGKPSANLYYHYYNAQAMINHGGSEWRWYNKMFQDELLDAQEKDGSWKQTMGHGPINTHMATCLATFMLEVYYRFLPGSNAD